MTTATPWILPADRRGLELARRLPGHRLVRGYTAVGTARVAEVLTRQGQPLPMNHPAQAALDHACATLGAPTRPRLLVSPDCTLRAMTIDTEQPLIAVTPSMLEVVDQCDGWAPLMGHEVAHLVAGHARARIQLGMLCGLGMLAGLIDHLIPLGINRRLRRHLMGWIQAGELSADRAGALVGGLDAKLRLLAALSAALPPEQRAPDPYEAAFDTHPPLDERMGALRAWRREGGLTAAAEIRALDAELSALDVSLDDEILDRRAAAELAALSLD